MTAVTYSPGRAVRFYVPLLLQAFSQSLTYPLVGSITSHGPDGWPRSRRSRSAR